MLLCTEECRCNLVLHTCTLVGLPTIHGLCDLYDQSYILILFSRAFSSFWEALGQENRGGPYNLFSFLGALSYAYSVLAKLNMTTENEKYD